MKIPRPIQRLINHFERLPGIGPKTAQRLVFHLLHFPQEEIEKFAENLIKFKADTQVCKICKNVGESNPCEICSDDAREISSIAVVSTPLDVFALERAGFKGKYHVLHGVIDPLNNIGPEQLFINDLVSRLKSILSIGVSSEALNVTVTPSEQSADVNTDANTDDDINSVLGNSSDAFDALDELFEATFNDVATDMGLERASEDEPTTEHDSGQEFDENNQEHTSTATKPNTPKVTQIELILATGTSMEGESTAMYLTKLLRESGLYEDKLKITRIARGLPVGGDIEYADDVTLLRALEGRSQY